MLQKISHSSVFKQIVEKYPDLEGMMSTELSWLEKHHVPAMDLIPHQYRTYTTKMLDEFIPRMDPTLMEDIDFR